MSATGSLHQLDLGTMGYLWMGAMKSILIYCRGRTI